MLKSPLPFVIKKPKFPKVKSEQRERRRNARMTLVASLSGREGTILFADTQEVIGDYAKRKIDKLEVINGRGFRFGIAGSCTDGTYADMLQSDICSALSVIESFDLPQIASQLVDALTKFYAKHIWPRSGQAPQMEYLLTVQSFDGGYPTVFHISETAANVCHEEVKTIGVGSYLADYLFKQMTAGDLPFPPSESMAFLCAAAVYVAMEVRENIHGVGPLDKIVLFNRDGSYDELYPIDILEIQESVGTIPEFLGYFYRDAFDGAARNDDKIISESQWAGDVRKGIIEWYEKWQSSEWRNRRESIRQTDKQRERASGE